MLRTATLIIRGRIDPIFCDKRRSFGPRNDDILVSHRSGIQIEARDEVNSSEGFPAVLAEYRVERLRVSLNAW